VPSRISTARVARLPVIAAVLVFFFNDSATTENLEIAFPAPDRETVDDFHRVALAIGCSDAGRPDARREHDTPVYGAAVVAPDGTRVESVLSHSS